MDSRDLMRLALVGIVSEGDTRRRITTLSPGSDGDVIEAWALGSYAAAGAIVSGSLPREVAVDSQKLLGAAKVFSSSTTGEITLRVVKNLIVTDGLTKQTIPLLSEQEPPFADIYRQEGVEVDLGELRREAREIGSAVSKMMTTPILTGLRIVAGKGNLGFEASNGYSLLIRSAIASEGESDLDVVASVGDLRRALTIVTGPRVKLSRLNNRLAVSNDDSFALIPLMGDGSVWPRTKFPPVSAFGQHVTIPVGVLADIVKASTVYPASSIIVRPEWGEAVIETEELGDGQFSVPLVGGRLVSASSLGASEIATLSRSAQGDDVALYIDGQHALAVLGDKRRAYLLLRYYQQPSP